MIHSFSACSPLSAILDTVVDYLLIKAFSLAQKFQGQMETIADQKLYAQGLALQLFFYMALSFYVPT